MTSWQKKYIYFVIFNTGMASLAIELSASRLVGNIFGNSNLVWASIIGLILIYLALGYYLGGKLSDKYPEVGNIFKILAWAGFTTGLIPVISRPILIFAARSFDQLEFSILLGSFVSVLVLFIFPVTMLGSISPFAIRLLVTNPNNAGKTAGQIYALSTLGSFIGTFLPVLFLIPIIGTNNTFFAISIYLLIIALLGIYKSKPLKSFLMWLWMPLVVLIFAIYLNHTPIKSSNNQILEVESAYNYIQVLEKDGYRYLKLNEGQGVHSIWHSDELFYSGPWEQFLAAPFFNSGDESGSYRPEKVKRIAIIGLAAGTTARQATAVFGPIPIDGFEIDPKIIEVGEMYFGMDMPNLNAIAQDGRLGLSLNRNTYTIIAVDAYRPPYIPWHLTTLEFFQLVYDHLDSDGVLAINVGRAPHDRRLIDGFTGTLLKVFPSVYVMDLPGTFNSIIYATKQPSTISNLYNNLLYLYTRDDIHPLLIEVIQRVVVFQKPVNFSDIVFTDDKAPIEWLTNNLVLNFILFEDLETLQ